MRASFKTRFVVLGAVVAFPLLQACLDGNLSPVPDATNTPYQGQRSECSTGPALTASATVRAGTAQSMQPECVQRCGTHPQASWGAGTSTVTIEGVPSGACTYNGEACSMVAVKPCCPGTTTGIAYVYECHCNLGAWTCTEAYHGGGACGACAPDAGEPEPVDAGITDASDAG